MNQDVMFKLMVFCAVVLQTTSVVLLIRYTKASVSEGDGYITSTVILWGEVVKVVVCVGQILYENSKDDKQSGVSWLLQPLRMSVLDDPVDSLKMAVPSVLFAVQNNLLFYALKNLQPSMYQICYQLKILTTAVFTVTMLGRSLSCAQCGWLFGLFLGVSITQAKFDGSDEDKVNTLNGLLAILGACATSGFAGVYMEKVMKRSAPSVFVRNIQLGLFGIIGTCIIIASQDSTEVMTRGFFAGYNSLTWVVILLHAAGGILIAVLIKYADNLIKNIATSVSVILSSVISWMFLGFQLTPQFVIGAVVVLGSAWGYSVAPGPPAAPAPTTPAAAEETKKVASHGRMV